MKAANAMGVMAAGALVAAGVALSPALPGPACAPGFISNPYAAQCLAPVSTATINGVPCVPSNLGLCNSFVQNQQPRRVPVSAVG